MLKENSASGTVKIMKKSGPRTDPSGAPHGTCLHLDIDLLIFAYCTDAVQLSNS